MTLSLPYNIVEHQSDDNVLTMDNAKEIIIDRLNIDKKTPQKIENENEFIEFIKSDVIKNMQNTGINLEENPTPKNLIKEIKKTIKNKIITPSDQIDNLSSNLQEDDNTKKNIYTKNDNENKIYIENQIRLNNLQKINRYKEIQIIFMYIILFVTCGLFVYFYKDN